MPTQPRAPPNEGNLPSDPRTSVIRDHHSASSGLTEADEKNQEVDEEQRVSFKIINKIGQGGYGLVYVVEKNEGIDKKAIYAMKVSKYHSKGLFRYKMTVLIQSEFIDRLLVLIYNNL